MKLNALIVIMLCISSVIKAEIKVDIDMSGRSTTEVTEPGYSAWVPTAGNLTVSGVTFKLSNASSSGSLSTTYYKVGVQAPNYARLVCDGAYVKDNTTNGELLLEITGLSAGTHTLLTYHNAVDAFSSTNKLSNMNIYVNNVLTVSNIVPSIRELSTYTAQTSYISFKVSSSSATTKIKFVPVYNSGANVYNVYLNGFELDVPNVKEQASSPYPTNGDMHVDADDKTCTMTWTAAFSAKSHNVYWGTDSAKVANASISTSGIYRGNQTATSYKVSDLYNLNTYYWRIDEVKSDGSITKGNAWKYRPRHLAFPEAEGYGRYATGGRGGKVVYVTNLNDDGDGSFRQAVTNEIGPRTIVFAVSGVVYLKSRLTCSSPYVTIAGQTAPGRGICFRASPFGVGGESICRFIRVRLGSGPTADGLGMAGAQYSITDHCSVGWTIDEAFSSRNAKNMTLQRTLISEALNIAGHQNYPEGTGHGYAATIGGDVGSFHHNLLAHNYGRNWSLGGGLDGNGYYAGRLDIFNNVVYNFGGRVTDGGAHEVNFVGNYYKKGAASKLNITLSADLEGAGLGSQAYYYHNNILQEKDGSYLCDGTNDECGRRYTLSNGQVLNWTLWNPKPFFESYAKIESARNAYKSVLSDVGCTMPLLDSHDERMITETLNGTYSCTGAKTQLGGIIDADSESKESYDYYTSESRPSGFDSDWDGLPDWWEEMFGTNVNSASGDFSDSNADPDGDGYTNLEDYLYWMSVPRVETSANESATLNLSDYFKGFTSSPSYSVASTPANVTVSVSDTKVTVTPKAAGIYYFKIKVKDSQGDVMTRTFGVKAEGVVAATASLSKCGSGDLNQTVNAGESLDEFCFSWDNASSVEYTGFPNGVTVTIDESSKKVTVSGTPNDKAGTYKFTISTKGENTNVSVEGTITLKVPTTYIYNCETNDLWTTTERWTPAGLPTEKDTVIIRTGEVKASGIEQIAPLKVESTGIFRLTGNCSVEDLTLQGGTLKSHTSNPLFVLTSSITVDENSTIWAGSVPASVFRIDGTISSSKNLEKTNVGVLNLNVDASNFSGVWTVSGGTLLASKSDALGTGGVNVKSTDTLKIAAANETAFLNMEETSNLTLDADLTVEKATLGTAKLAAGSYTSADYPNFISGGGKLIVTEGEATSMSFINSNDFNVAVIPNPIIDDALITIFSEKNQLCNIQLFGLDGNIVYQTTFLLKMSKNSIHINMKNLAFGIYLLNVQMESKVENYKIIKK